MGGEDTGSFLVRLINLAINSLTHNPKRALIILFSVFVGTLLVGEFVGRSRQIDKSAQLVRPTVEYKDSASYFNLQEIKDTSPSPTETIFSSDPVVIVRPTKTFTPEESFYITPTPSCTTEIVKGGLEPGKNAKVTYPGGYEMEINIRAALNNSQAIVGSVKSGRTVYLLDGPVCHGGVRWWKVNEIRGKVIGWLPETINNKPLLEITK